MSRSYAIEPTPTLTGVAADHRFIAGPRDLDRIVPALAAAVLHGETPSNMPSWFAPLAAEMKTARGRTFIHAGPHQPPETHALVHAMNEALGGRGATYTLIDPVEADPVDQAASMHDLMADMQSGRVTSLQIIDSNPVFTQPGFGDALKRVPFSMTLAAEPTETSGTTHWNLPARHSFEDWSDARAYDGTITILQPQARPLYDGLSPHDLLALFSASAEADSRGIVRQTHGLTDDQRHDALASGVVPNTAHVSGYEAYPGAAGGGHGGFGRLRLHATAFRPRHRARFCRRRHVLAGNIARIGDDRSSDTNDLCDHSLTDACEISSRETTRNRSLAILNRSSGGPATSGRFHVISNPSLTRDSVSLRV